MGQKCQRFPSTIRCCLKNPLGGPVSTHSPHPSPSPPSSPSPFPPGPEQGSSAGGFQTFGPVAQSQSPVSSSARSGACASFLSRRENAARHLLTELIRSVKSAAGTRLYPVPGRGPGLGGSTPAWLPRGHCHHAGPRTRASQSCSLRPRPRAGAPPAPQGCWQSRGEGCRGAVTRRGEQWVVRNLSSEAWQRLSRAKD